MHNHVIFALQSLVGFPKLCLIRFTINSNVHKFEVDVKCFIFFVIFSTKELRDTLSYRAPGYFPVSKRNYARSGLSKHSQQSINSCTSGKERKKGPPGVVNGDLRSRTSVVNERVGQCAASCAAKRGAESASASRARPMIKMQDGGRIPRREMYVCCALSRS